MKKKLSAYSVTAIIIAVFAVLSLILVIGADTAWGKVRVEKMLLSSADGDVVNALLYKPKSATAENPAPAIVLYHGGNDMLEHTGTYALELARRGYVVVNFDYQGSHDSDYATAESVGETSFCGDTIYNTLSNYNFVQQDNIGVFGHSMGGGYASKFAANYAEHVKLLFHLGSAVVAEPGPYNYVSVVGDSDESALKRTTVLDEKTGKTTQDIHKYYNSPELAAAWGEPDGSIVPGKQYHVDVDGKDCLRVFYFPHAIHAYYNVNNNAVKQIIYAFLVGMDGYGNIDNVDLSDVANGYKGISTVWKIKDFGWILEYLAICALMFLTAARLIKTDTFKTLELQPSESYGFKKYSVLWFVFLGALLVLPPLLYLPGVRAAEIGLFPTKFNTDNPVTKIAIDSLIKTKWTDANGVAHSIWLLGGTSNVYVLWQWLTAAVMLVVFLIYFFVRGHKAGENYRSLGFATSDTKKFSIGYIFKAMIFGIIVVGAGYLLMMFIGKYTQQGLHITTLQMSNLSRKRVMCWIVYFVYLIPYFLCTHLATKSLGIKYDGTAKNLFFNVLKTTAICVGGLFVFYVIFACQLNFTHTVMEGFRTGILYAYGLAILPLTIGITVGNALNVYISSKTKSVWPGLFTAVLWGVWTLCSTGGMTNNILFK
ncbi:MAG: alpha/beta hydrolase [Lachnospiraceae bacterium]|nr:alpha/beta hydrolase [Lachnospiraceae bacterium]